MISKAAIPDVHALLVRDLREPHFDPHWHHHPEYELFAVLEGTGTRFVGDDVERFGPGDVVLTGPHLPHVYFKERTNKPLTRFVAELRIGYACKLLVERDLPISRLAHECGYPTLSNFNRQFRSVAGMTPSAYKQAYAAALPED